MVAWYQFSRVFLPQHAFVKENAWNKNQQRFSRNQLCLFSHWNTVYLYKLWKVSIFCSISLSSMRRFSNYNQNAQWCIESFALSMYHDFEFKWCVRCDSFIVSCQMIRCDAKNRDYRLYDNANNFVYCSNYCLILDMLECFNSEISNISSKFEW